MIDAVSEASLISTGAPKSCPRKEDVDGPLIMWKKEETRNKTHEQKENYFMSLRGKKGFTRYFV